MYKAIRADVVHIGFQKAATTFLSHYFKQHAGVTTDRHNLRQPLWMQSWTLNDKPSQKAIHISVDERLSESIIISGDWNKWHSLLHVPGAWNNASPEIRVDPNETARRLHKMLGDVKVFMVIRDQIDWLQSYYRYCIPQLPPGKRSFLDFISTPDGVVTLETGHYDRTISAYLDTFGANKFRVFRFEDLISSPVKFAVALCDFLDVGFSSLPAHAENETHTQIARLQRLLPVSHIVPPNLRKLLKRYARFIPGGRASILSETEIKMLLSLYAESNQRTAKLMEYCSPATLMRL